MDDIVESFDDSLAFSMKREVLTEGLRIKLVELRKLGKKLKMLYSYFDIICEDMEMIGEN